MIQMRVQTMVLKKLLASSLSVSCLVMLAASLAFADDMPSLEMTTPYPQVLTPVSAIIDNARLDEPLPLKPADPEMTLELPKAAPPSQEIGPQPPAKPAGKKPSQAVSPQKPAAGKSAKPATAKHAKPAQPQAAEKQPETVPAVAPSQPDQAAAPAQTPPPESAAQPAPAPAEHAAVELDTPVPPAAEEQPEAPEQSAVASDDGVNKKTKKHIKPISYSPVPAIAIFPVIKTGSERAFSDLPVLFAREIAQGMENQAAGTKIYHPVYTVDELKMRGLGHIYDKVMRYYVQAGRPEPAAMDYMLKQLSSQDRPITRVVFVEADLDLNHAADPAGAWDRTNAWLTDAVPSHTKYHIRSRLQVFNTEDPEMHRTWSWSWNKSIKTDKFYNVTPSVFADSDSQQAFAAVSRQMTREIMLAMSKLGKTAYMDPLYDTSVSGQLAKEPPFPNLSEKAPKNGITTTDREAIERILRRQNSIAP